ncbi:reverse transcriptase domain-containing protein [Tanacetum coccineum]
MSSTRNQSASLKNLETQIEQLTEEIRSDKTLSSSEQIKTVTADQETSGLNKLHRLSFISEFEGDTPEVLQHQLPHKELNLGSFTLPYTISKFKFYVMADLGASINVMPRSIFERLHLTNLKKTNILCEMVDMSKNAPLGIVENVFVNIDKFLFPSDFVIINNTPSETIILGRPFLATIHAEIDVFAGKISLGINEDRISFDSMKNNIKYTNPSERIFMVRPQSPAQNNSAFENNPTHRSFDDYKREFNLEIDKLADEYELGIGKNGHILDTYENNCSISINRGLIQAIPTSLPPQPIGEATKALNLRRIPPGNQTHSFGAEKTKRTLGAVRTESTLGAVTQPTKCTFGAVTQTTKRILDAVLMGDGGVCHWLVKVVRCQWCFDGGNEVEMMVDCYRGGSEWWMTAGDGDDGEVVVMVWHRLWWVARVGRNLAGVVLENF